MTNKTQAAIDQYQEYRRTTKDDALLGCDMIILACLKAQFEPSQVNDAARYKPLFFGLYWRSKN